MKLLFTRINKLASKNTIKIVAATNVAEASITIPDVTVVIDTCRVKEMGFDSELQTSGLTMKFKTKTRTCGRVQKGRCFRLITKGAYEKQPMNSIPEILRLPLESIVLQILTMQQTQRKQQQQQYLVYSTMCFIYYILSINVFYSTK